MVRRRGVARISAPRRRVFRIKTKWDPQIAARRMKLLLPIIAAEFDWEMQVLLWLEQDVYGYLTAQAVPTELWEYYMAFAKRMWERRVHFLFETFLLEKASLVSEFTLRGLNPDHLREIQVFAEQRGIQKLGLIRFRLVEEWGALYREPPDMVAIFSEEWGAMYPGPPTLTQIFSEDWSS